MAETAKILSPEKIVVLPDMNAGCSLEDSCPPDQFKAFREAHPDHIALTYINCSAAVKALSDIIVTSSSAEIILSQIPKEQKIIFGPDKHLGGYLARKTGRDMLLWPGVCIVHEAFSETELLKLKAQHPGAPVLAHPECPPHILDHADHVGSTRAILDYALSLAGRDADRRHRAAHHPPDGEGGAAQELHRRARRGRQLQLQHVPLHGAEHDGEALRRACATSSRGSSWTRSCASPRRSRSTGCSRWRAGRSGRATSGGR